MVFWYMKPTKQHPLGGPSLLFCFFLGDLKDPCAVLKMNDLYYLYGEGLVEMSTPASLGRLPAGSNASTQKPSISPARLLLKRLLDPQIFQETPCQRLDPPAFPKDLGKKQGKTRKSQGLPYRLGAKTGKTPKAFPKLEEKREKPRVSQRFRENTGTNLTLSQNNKGASNCVQSNGDGNPRGLCRTASTNATRCMRSLGASVAKPEYWWRASWLCFRGLTLNHNNLSWLQEKGGVHGGTFFWLVDFKRKRLVKGPAIGKGFKLGLFIRCQGQSFIN